MRLGPVISANAHSGTTIAALEDELSEFIEGGEEKFLPEANKVFQNQEYLEKYLGSQHV
ncbi:MAG TPA: hypothetical protein V6C97_11705 [Oculatellaceae cyanobacterium]